MLREISSARTISRLLDLHCRKRRKAAAQRLHDRRAGRRHQFDLRTRRIYWRLPKQLQRRRRRYWKRSVRALDGSATHVQRRAYPFPDRQGFHSNRGADNIHHGIDGTHFVKVDLIDGRIVNLGFGLAQCLKDANRGCLRRAADRGFFDDLANFRQAATVFVVMGVAGFARARESVAP